MHVLMCCQQNETERLLPFKHLGMNTTLHSGYI